VTAEVTTTAGITIQPYPLPSPGTAPAGRARWRADPRRAALLVHDMQRYFLDFFPERAEPLTTLLRHTTALRAAAARAGMPVYYTAQPGAMSAPERGLLEELWGDGMPADDEARGITDVLAPGPEDTVLTKWRYSAFFRTGLLDRLRAEGRDQLVICGVYAHVGCLTTAMEAYSHDIEVFMPADAVADFGPEQHRWAVEVAADTCAVTAPTDMVLAALDAPSATGSAPYPAAASEPRKEARDHGDDRHPAPAPH
jgi:isochorismate hydrolase